jgi:large subunit ribosomal protein L39
MKIFFLKFSQITFTIHIHECSTVCIFLPDLCSRAQRLTNAEVNKKRNELFAQEKARQLALITRVEKIEVHHIGPPEDCRLLMNKSLSTPFNCAMRKLYAMACGFYFQVFSSSIPDIQELLMNRSVLALVNGKPWDMHRPLVADCELRFLHFKDEDPALSNQVS